MKKIFRMLLSVVVAVSMSGCIWVVDNKDKEPDGTNNEGSTDSGNTPEEGNAGAEKYMSFVFDPQPTEYEGFMQINIYPSDQFLYFAWDTVRASTTLSYGTVEAYVKARVAKAVENGETYAGWKSEGKICCSNLGWTMEFEPNTEYYVYAFQVNGEKLAIYGHVSSHKFKTPMASAQPETPTIVEKAPDGYLDMGLPSKTHWYNNATGWWDYYTYNELNNIIPEHAQGGAIPSKEQWNELRQYCKWEWDGAGFEISNTKNSKMSFYLPFIGAYNEGGEKVDDETHGYYWTRTLDGNQVSMAVITNDGVIDFQKVSATGGWKMSGIFVWKP